MPSASEPVPQPNAGDILAAVREIQASWKNRDFPAVASLSRALLERLPGNVHGLAYLARSAAQTHDWAVAAQAAAELAEQKPLEAFAIARQISRAGMTLMAARLFASLDFTGDWLDAKTAELAHEQGLDFLEAAQTAVASEDAASARVLLTAATRLAPHSRRALLLQGRLTAEFRKAALALDFGQDPDGYLKAWREVLSLKPADVLALSRIAQATERVDVRDGVDAWLAVIAAAPDQPGANNKLRTLARRHDLEDRVIRGLIGQGRDERSDPLILELAESRDAKARAARDKLVRAAVQHAHAADRDHDPRRSIAAWKAVLAMDSKHLTAARRVVAAARQLGDNAELVEGLSAILEIQPGDAQLAQRLATAGLRSGREQRVLDLLVRQGVTDLTAQSMAALHRRVLVACRSALNAGDFDLALSCLRTLELADAEPATLEQLRSIVAGKAAAGARGAERAGDLIASVSLAEKVLQIVPDHPIALSVVARDQWRRRRFGDLVELCGPRVKPGPEYAAVQKLLDRAAAMA